MAITKYVRARPRRFRRYGKKSVAKKAIRRARAKAFRKKVLSVVSRKAENKLIATSINNSILNDAPTSSSNIMQILPNMLNGTGTNQRVGDEVTLKSFNVKLLLDHAPPITANSAAHTYYGIRVMIVQPKQFRGWSQISANADSWLASLFRDGATNIGFNTASPKAVLMPINTDEITVYYDKVYYENFVTISQSATAPTTYITSYNQTQWGHKELSINLKVNGKKLRYDASVNSGLTPTNFNPCLVVGICNLNGTTVTSSNMNFSMYSVVKFEDL